MNKKYRELPAFETNEFRIGDIINVYIDSGNPFKEEVLNVRNNLVKTSANKVIHFKSLRKLEEIKGRLFWIKDSPNGRVSVNTMVSEENESGDWIKVREVLEGDD